MPASSLMKNRTLASLFAFAALLALAGSAFSADPGSRTLLDAHNAYPDQGRWADRLERALSTGIPIAIEQDLVWVVDPFTGLGKSIVSHGAPFTGEEPSLEEYFFETLRPHAERVLRATRDDAWPLVTLNLDFKTNEPEHHRAVWDLLGRYEEWLTTSERLADPGAIAPLRAGPLLVLTGADDSQERSFHDAIAPGERLRLFGAVHDRPGTSPVPMPGPKTNYRRWWNLPWRVVEPEGQPHAGSWTEADRARLEAVVDAGHDAGLWVRFYTLNGHDPADGSGGWSAGYNFGSLDAARVRWNAAIRAGVDFVAVDQYEEFARTLADARAQGDESAPSHAASEVVMEGTLTRDDYERLMELPFEVEEGIDRLEISLEYEGVERKTVIDLGLRGPRGFRGWSGGGAQTISVGRTFSSYGYLPGAPEPGRWAVVLGVPNIREESRDAYRVTVRKHRSDPPAFPVLHDAPGWYTGDLHSHSGHSDGRAFLADGSRVRIPPHRVYDAARAAGLDFVALSEHNTSSHWLEVDRMQPYYPDVLLLHAREVTTYNGHANAFGEREFVDFRVMGERRLSDVLQELAQGGALVSINHPAAPDDERCMGCGWSALDAESLRSVHAVEIVNGADAEGPLAGWPVWASLLNRGFRLTAIGGSDEHTADDRSDQALGAPATVIWAESLSEPALVEGLRRARVFVRVRGANGPSIEFTAVAGHGKWEMGETIPAAAGEVRLVAKPEGASGQTLVWIRNGKEAARAAVGDDRELEWSVRAAPGDWFTVVLRDERGPTLFGNAIYVSG